MISIDYSSRLTSAFRYHDFLSKHSDSSWIDTLEAIETDIKTGIPEVMVLLHPRWHEELSFQASSDPRGLGSFSPANLRAKCRSFELWGYECPYEGSKIHIDHTFPFARGGATRDDNAMYLCREHNLSKSTDIHSIPWETLIKKQWILDQLKLFLIMGQRLTAKELYLPTAAMIRA
jgi:hypothetical protein